MQITQTSFLEEYKVKSSCFCTLLKLLYAVYKSTFFSYIKTKKNWIIIFEFCRHVPLKGESETKCPGVNCK